MLSEKQNKIRAFGFTNYDALICDGAIRSGKSSVMSVAFVDWAMRNFNGKNFAWCGQSYGAVYKNIVLPYLNLRYAQKRYQIRYSRSNALLLIKSGSVENYIYLYGGRDESSYKMIQGITLAGILFDEVVLQPRSFVDQGLGRCSVDGSKFWFNCNPGSPTHWFYNEWILKIKEKNSLYLHFQLEDNPSLSEKIVKRYKSQWSGIFYQRYILGLWVRAEGVIFKQFSEHPEHWILKEPPNDILWMTFGIDFGVNHSKTIFICTGIRARGAGVVILEEYRRDCTGVAPDAIEHDFVVFAKKCIDKYKYKPTYCWTDQPETLTHGIAAAVRRAGLSLGVTIARKEQITTRIYAKEQMLNKHKWAVMENCQMVIYSTQNQLWDEKFPGKDVRLDNDPNVNDVADAEEYSWEAFIDEIGVRA